MLDVVHLGDERVELQPEPRHEIPRHLHPVHLGVRHHVRVVVADGTRDLAQDGRRRHLQEGSSGLEDRGFA